MLLKRGEYFLFFILLPGDGSMAVMKVILYTIHTSSVTIGSMYLPPGPIPGNAAQVYMHRLYSH